MSSLPAGRAATGYHLLCLLPLQGQLYGFSTQKLDWNPILEHLTSLKPPVRRRNERANMAADVDIDELLKQDEAALREKKKRLKALQNALDESRTATKKTQTAAAATLHNGDLTRAELTRFFDLSKSERADLLPATPRTPTRAKDNTTQDAEEPDRAHNDQP